MIFSHAFTTALRHFRRYRLYVLANIAGLGIGLAGCLLIALYVQHELSYDRFHSNADRIYRVASTLQRGNVNQEYASAPAPLGPALAETLPEVVDFVRLYPARTAPPRLTYADHTFWEPGFLYADVSIFEVFDFALLRGDPATALASPYTVVLTASTAQRYFGDADPMGKVLTSGDSTTFTVTGVVADIPANSHVTFDFLASLSTKKEALANPGEWRNSGYYTYLLLACDASMEAVQQKVPSVIAATMPVDMPDLFAYNLQPLTQIHLHSLRRHELGSNGRMVLVYLFSGIALLTLLIACLNYVNLATAQAARRAREVGVRKATGANRLQLAAQFIGEALLLCGASFVLALFISYLALPSFSTLMERPLALGNLGLWGWSVTIGTVLVVGVLSGAYPALYLAALRPAQVLKGAFQPGAPSAFRQGMVVVQLAVATLLIISTLVVRGQLQYMQDRPLGFSTEQVIALPMNDDAGVAARYEVLKETILQQPATTHVTASSGTPGRASTFYTNPVRVVGQDETLSVRSLVADDDFVATYQLNLLAGRLPTPVSVERKGNFFRGEFLITETLAQELGWIRPEDALGRLLNWKGSIQGEVVGVVSDFHFLGLQQAVEPVLIAGFAPMFNYISIRVNTTDVARTLANLEADWQRILPDRPFDYFFVDADYARQYHDETRLARLTNMFSALAIWLACLGLFGLAAYAAERRTREIGVRKVMGASIRQIIVLLASDFLKLGLLALAIATPIALIAARQWLDQFAYQMHLGPSPFVLAGSLVLLLLLIAVSYRSIQAALADPVHSLRHE